MRVYRSAWVVPVETAPIPDGAVALEPGGVVAEVGPAVEVLARWSERAQREHGASGVTDLGPTVLLPGLVNAHTHLELSWMKNQRPPRGEFLAWVRGMIDRRPPPAVEVEAEVQKCIAALEAAGTVAIGDVGNTTAALGPLRASSLTGRFFLEVIGWEWRGAARFHDAVRVLDDMGAHTVPGMGGAAATSARVPASIVPHGPHSVDHDILEKMAGRARARGDVLSIHLAESAEEIQLLRRGEGAGRVLLDEIGALPRGWRPPGLSPAQILDRSGLLGPRTLVVHGVHLTAEDARLLASRGATLVVCPRSNAWLDVGAAPVPMLLDSEVRLALGTDSLASNDDLDLFAELSALRALAPAAPPDALLRAATLGGAEALGVSASFGSIARGKRGPLVALPLRASADAGAERTSSAAHDEEPYRTIFAGAKPSGLSLIRG